MAAIEKRIEVPNTWLNKTDFKNAEMYSDKPDQGFGKGYPEVNSGESMKRIHLMFRLFIDFLSARAALGEQAFSHLAKEKLEGINIAEHFTEIMRSVHSIQTDALLLNRGDRVKPWLEHTDPFEAVTMCFLLTGKYPTTIDDLKRSCDDALLDSPIWEYMRNNCRGSFDEKETNLQWARRGFAVFGG